MEYRIEKHEEIKVVGIKISTTNKKRQGYKQIPKLWKSFVKDEVLCNQLLKRMDGNPKGMLGINIYNTNKDDAQIFDYMIGVATTKEDVEGLESYTIPARTWAIFPCTQKSIGKTEYNIITKWEPTAVYRVLNQGYASGYMEGYAPDLEVNGIDNYAEVWVAVEEK